MIVSLPFPLPSTFPCPPSLCFSPSLSPPPSPPLFLPFLPFLSLPSPLFYLSPLSSPSPLPLPLPPSPSPSLSLSPSPTPDVSSHMDDEYAWAGVEDPKVVITTSHNPSSRLKQFAKVGSQR